MAETKGILLWELGGVLFLIVVGSLLHFVFEWSNSLPAVGLLTAVNESVWEHLKLGFWSLILFSLLEYWFIKNETNNFFLAKALGILSLQLTIIVVFYTYTTFSGKPILFIDISSYILGSVFCQIVSYKILTHTKPSTPLNYAGTAVILVHGVLLMVFTFIPPNLPVFYDTHNQCYGIPVESVQTQSQNP